MLRQAIEAERRRRQAVTSTLDKAGIYEPNVAGGDGNGFTIRVPPAAPSATSSGTTNSCRPRDPAVVAVDTVTSDLILTAPAQVTPLQRAQGPLGRLPRDWSSAGRCAGSGATPG